jgi:hypothetical protein
MAGIEGSLSMQDLAAHQGIGGSSMEAPAGAVDGPAISPPWTVSCHLYKRSAQLCVVLHIPTVLLKYRQASKHGLCAPDRPQLRRWRPKVLAPGAPRLPSWEPGLSAIRSLPVHLPCRSSLAMCLWCKTAAWGARRRSSGRLGRSRHRPTMQQMLCCRKPKGGAGQACHRTWRPLAPVPHPRQQRHAAGSASAARDRATASQQRHPIPQHATPHWQPHQCRHRALPAAIEERGAATGGSRLRLMAPPASLLCCRRLSPCAKPPRPSPVRQNAPPRQCVHLINPC